MSNIYGVDFKSGKYTGSTFKTEHQFTLDPFQSNWSNRSWSLSNVPFEKARVTLSSQPDAFIDLSIDSGGVSEIATIQLSRNNIKLKASGLSTIYPKTYSGGGIERTLPISVNGNYAGTNGNITIAGGGSGLDTTKIPLSGTVAGKPVTGNIRTTAITAIVSNGADMAIGIDESLNLEDIQNGAMVYFEKKLNNIASLWARKNDTIVKVSAISDGHNSRLIVDANNSTSRGISGALDYTPNITNVDYTQKIYVDRKADSLAKTLTRVGDSIRLISKGGIVLSTVNAPIGGGGGVTVTSYGKNATKDSTILLLSNGIRYAAKDSIGTGGGGTDTTYIVACYGVKIDSL